MTNSQIESESSVSHLSHEKVESAWSKGNKKRIENRLQEINNSVKNHSSSVQDYIRIFEPLVIGAMRRYTVSTDERIQKSVLRRGFIITLFISFSKSENKEAVIDLDMSFLNIQSF